MTLLSSTDYPSVRAAIDTSLDSAVLPDALIARDVFVGAAELDVLARDPLAASRTGTDATRITLAAIYLTAARLCPAVPNIIEEEDTGQHRYRRQATDWTKRAAELRGMADAEIQAILAPTATTPGRPTMFVAASGRRGR